MPLPQKLTKFTTISPRVLTYDWVDVADGSGNIKFYLFQTEITGPAVDYHLGRQVIYSSSRFENLTTAGTNDLDYDFTSFNSPREIEGTAILNIPYDVFGSAACTFKIVCKLRKWDGVTETEIANVTSPTIATTAEVHDVWCLPIVVPYTHFAEGETLRLTIEGTLTGGGATPHAGYGIDPKSRTYAAQTITDSNIQIPFKTNN